ncbi:competence-damage inducible protein [Gracilibacillus halophilus YIM-C55.5]|uniref:Putative competence-damage inducible protein n=1 Tax=Gracilibacillus halophilus YIM-C55.5 TaxID=1308866 RepID=N4W8C6_9BACI|nr:competence/damage-inducible protein A [Gracilibacillus halophilus]ENH96523.1 competence-damage inducible protein [Gracilibacillus halophilus YIM-C55.5]
MKNVKAEIISVGTELLLGQIVNSNAAWMSKKLANIGVSVYYHTVVGDNLQRLRDVFELAADRSDVVFVTGGLGPTEDDLTREAFEQVSGLKVVEDENILQHIADFFKKRNMQMTPNNRKQAHVFEGSKIFDNQVGIAPGIQVEYNDVQWLFMPGVPREMQAIMDNKILPFVAEYYSLDAIIQSRVLRFIGIGESQLEHQLQDMISEQTNPTIAPLATEGEVSIRLTAKAFNPKEADQLIDEVEDRIMGSVGDYFYGYNDTSIDQKVFDLLQKKHLTIASAESFTAGGFASKLAARSGASSIFHGSAVVYQPESKQKVLGVSKRVIDDDGTVSQACAEDMAIQVRDVYQSDVGISFTGVAGPNPSEGKEVGTVFISIATKQNVATHKFLFHGDREAIQTRSIKKGYALLYQMLQ